MLEPPSNKHNVAQVLLKATSACVLPNTCCLMGWGNPVASVLCLGSQMQQEMQQERAGMQGILDAGEISLTPPPTLWS